MTDTQTREATRPPFWRDVRVLRVIVQVAAVVVVFFILRYFFGNLTTNLARLGISTSFDFLFRPTNFQIPFHQEFDPRSPVWQMVAVGVKNTFIAGVLGIVLASITGLIVGISRLSENWLTARLASLYVEFFRNIPPLVIIIFFGFALFTFGEFPQFAESSEIGLPGSDNNLFLINNDRWGIPGITQTSDLLVFYIIAVVGLFAAILVWRWRTKAFDRTGQPHHRLIWFTGVVIAALLIAFFVTGQPLEMSWPVLSENRRTIEGGLMVNWGFMSLTLALGFYTASHIAEIIRGSILAVHSGQSEAANALALSAFQRYRFVVLPQAMRVALPPTINQFLNLIKNTSLGTVVSYAEVTSLTVTSVGNGRPAFQSFILLMAVYLAFSLTISLVLNTVNRRLTLVTN